MNLIDKAKKPTTSVRICNEKAICSLSEPSYPFMRRVKAAAEIVTNTQTESSCMIKCRWITYIVNDALQLLFKSSMKMRSKYGSLSKVRSVTRPLTAFVKLVLSGPLYTLS